MGNDRSRTPGEERSSKTILTVNGGSSSIKFAVYANASPPRRLLFGQIERIGEEGASLVATGGDGRPAREKIDAADHARAAERLVGWLEAHGDPGQLAAIGHRVVHGGVHLTRHQWVTPELVEELKGNRPLDLAHLPREIALIETLGRKMPGVPQVACFDTEFHRNLPRLAELLPIPRSYAERGVRRLGFHGLSYAYLLGELRRVAGDGAADGRVILAHLGSGASLAAVHKGKPVDTTMAFTPISGLVMGTRPGDLDPGLIVYLMRVEKMTPASMDDFITNKCGLLGISQTSSDMRDLLDRRKSDSRAAEAVDVFCYQARKWIGAFAAALGGLDTLVFSGGIGEHAVEVRRQICEGLQFLNLHVDDDRNARGGAVVSSETSAVTVRVMATDEEIMIARAVQTLLEER